MRSKKTKMPPAPEHAAFLRSILEQPFDNVPRLVYADWLEENGNTDDCVRAQYIRLHCQLSRTKKGRKHRGVPEMLYGYPVVIEDCRCRYCVLKRRIDHISAWTGRGVLLGPVAKECQPLLDYCERGRGGIWSRGFVKSVTITTMAFLHCARELFRVAPITDVSLGDRLPRAGTWGTQPGWTWHQELENYPLHNNYDLPTGLFECLATSSLKTTCFPRFLQPYPSMEDAQTALSRACVNFGRNQAGLPPLAWPTTS